jgi:hypothetical protein
MKVLIDIPPGTHMLLKAEQLRRRSNNDPVNLRDIVIECIEEHYSNSPLTNSLIKQMQESLNEKAKTNRKS